MSVRSVLPSASHATIAEEDFRTARRTTPGSAMMTAANARPTAIPAMNVRAGLKIVRRARERRAAPRQRLVFQNESFRRQ